MLYYVPVLEPNDETLEFPELDGLVIPDPNEVNTQLVTTLNRSSTRLVATVQKYCANLRGQPKDNQRYLKGIPKCYLETILIIP